MRIEHNTGKHQFEAYDDDGKQMGTISYQPGETAITADHTWTSDEFRGMGVAGKMLDAMVEYAIANNLKIIPVCSYVVASFEKDPKRFQAVMQ